MRKEKKNLFHCLSYLYVYTEAMLSSISNLKSSFESRKRTHLKKVEDVSSFIKEASSVLLFWWGVSRNIPKGVVVSSEVAMGTDNIRWSCELLVLWWNIPPPCPRGRTGRENDTNNCHHRTNNSTPDTTSLLGWINTCKLPTRTVKRMKPLG